MIIPYNAAVPMQRWPIANWALIVVTCAVSIWLFTLHDLPAWAVNAPGRVVAPGTLGSVLAHADVIHLLGNMVFLFAFGNAVNAKIGHAPYLLLYALIAAAEGSLWALLGSGDAVGASGAIMGVVGAFLVFYPRNDVSIFYWFGVIAAGSIEISAYWVIAAYLAFDVWGLATDGSGAVAYLSHLSGFATGFGLALAFVACGLFASEDFEENILEATGLRSHPRET